MWVPPNDSLFWVYARQGIIGIVMLGFCAFAYKNGMSSADILMILTTAGSVLGIDLVKRNASKKDDAGPTKE